jgi:hypothetical protein
MRVLGIHFFLISLLLSFAQGSKPSLGFELVGAYYAYKLENQAFGQNNPNHAQNFAQGCKTSRPGKSICSFDEFVRHVMPRVGTRFINGGNWGGPDPENPDVRTVGRDFPRANSNPAWSIDFKDIDMKSMNTEVGFLYSTSCR